MNNKFQGAIFRKGKLGASKFLDCTFMFANLTSGNIGGAIFQKCNFRGAVLKDVQTHNWDKRLLKEGDKEEYNVEPLVVMNRLVGFGGYGYTKKNLYLFQHCNPVNFSENEELEATQLLEVSTLYGVEGLPSDLERQLKLNAPTLFNDPSYEKTIDEGKYFSDDEI